jgi:hypothetical protein
MSKHHYELIQMVQWFFVKITKKGHEHVFQLGKHGKYEEGLYYKKKQMTEGDDGRTRCRGDQVAGAKDQR